MACILLWSSAVRVHDSQANKKMDVTREHISCILELREILMSFQTCFNLVSVAVVCAILESILKSTSGLEPSSVITEPRSQASVHLFWYLCRCHWHRLSSAWSSGHWSPCRRLWRFCSDAQLILPGLLPLLLSHRCHQHWDTNMNERKGFAGEGHWYEWTEKFSDLSHACHLSWHTDFEKIIGKSEHEESHWVHWYEQVNEQNSRRPFSGVVV